MYKGKRYEIAFSTIIFRVDWLVLSLPERISVKTFGERFGFSLVYNSYQDRASQGCLEYTVEVGIRSDTTLYQTYHMDLEIVR